MSKFDQYLKKHQAVLVDFYAEWCGPCKTMAPILKDVANQFKGELNIIKIDVDKNQKVSGQFNVRNIPTLILFKNGKQVWRKSGALPASEIEKAYKQHF